MWRRIRGEVPDMTISRIPRAWLPETKSGRCGGKTSLEGNNSSSICYVTFLVYFLTMASSAGREIMNGEVVGSILAVFPVKRKKWDFLMFKNL